MVIVKHRQTRDGFDACRGGREQQARDGSKCQSLLPPKAAETQTPAAQAKSWSIPQAAPRGDDEPADAQSAEQQVAVSRAPGLKRPVEDAARGRRESKPFFLRNQLA